MYNVMTDQDFSFLDAVAAGRMLTGEQISEDYGHDELGGIYSMPQAVVQVCSTDEVSRIVTYANQRRIPVVVRGSGTGLVGGAVAVHGGILLETVKMNQILHLDRENLTVTVQPGVLLMDLTAFVEQNGLFYPPDPGEKAATIGGNISTNAGGMRAVRYGVTRDFVYGLTVVLPTGEVVELGGKVVKNSSGYSLLDLVIGSEGTLGIITEAVLRLLPLPTCTASLLAAFPEMEVALGLVPAILQAGHIPTAMEYLSGESIRYAEQYLGKRFPDHSSDHYLLLTVDGEPESVYAQLDTVAKLCLHAGALDAYLVDTEERRDSVWSARGAFLEAIKASTTEMDECDVVVPRSCIAEYIRFARELAKNQGVRMPFFGHAGDGNLHIYLCRDNLPEDCWHTILETCFTHLYQKAAKMGGLVSGEHGIGWAKRSYLHRQFGDTQLRLMRSIKRAFDPNGILNPDKVFFLEE